MLEHSLVPMCCRSMPSPECGSLRVYCPSFSTVSTNLALTPPRTSPSLSLGRRQSLESGLHSAPAAWSSLIGTTTAELLKLWAWDGSSPTIECQSASEWKGTRW